MSWIIDAKTNKETKRVRTSEYAPTTKVVIW